MSPHLLYRDRDFEEGGRLWNETELEEDLFLDAVFSAMAGDDKQIAKSVRQVLFAGTDGNIETIRYRQHILQDCLDNPETFRGFYEVVSEMLKNIKYHSLEFFNTYPAYVLQQNVDTLESLIEPLRNLSKMAFAQRKTFKSEGWRQFIARLKQNFTTEYIDDLEEQLKQLKAFDESLFMSAKLGEGNKGTEYILHKLPKNKSSWWKKPMSLLMEDESAYNFSVNAYSESAIQALNNLEGRGLAATVIELKQSVDNITGFIWKMEDELAFYIGCLNLYEKLNQKGLPVCMPSPNTEENQLSAQGLYDIALALRLDKGTVGNNIDAYGKNLIVITGANSGGKSTFLRSIGVAQLMMQSGMYVGAKSFSSSYSTGIFTHFKKDEDSYMESGKFDEELKRINDIIDHVTPRSIVFLNESFSTTNEREGSKIARGVIAALRKRRIRILFVTHLFNLAHDLYKKNDGTQLFLRADHKPDGTRTFEMVEGEPLPTGFGHDLYKEIFKV